MVMDDDDDGDWLIGAWLIGDWLIEIDDDVCRNVHEQWGSLGRYASYF